MPAVPKVADAEAEEAVEYDFEAKLMADVAGNLADLLDSIRANEEARAAAEKADPECGDVGAHAGEVDLREVASRVSVRSHDHAASSSSGVGGGGGGPGSSSGSGLVPVLPALVQVWQPSNWPQYAQFLQAAANPRYTNVVNVEGKVIGQLQVNIAGDRPCSAAALCWHSGHTERCSRRRGWSPNSTESPHMVDWVLAHWLLKASQCVSTAKHMQEKRY